MINIKCKFQTILCTSYLVTAAFDDFTLIQGKNLCTTEDILTKLYVHNHVILINICSGNWFCSIRNG